MEREDIDKIRVLWDLCMGVCERGVGEVLSIVLCISDYSTIPLTKGDPSTTWNWIQQT